MEYSVINPHTRPKCKTASVEMTGFQGWTWWEGCIFIWSCFPLSMLRQQQDKKTANHVVISSGWACTYGRRKRESTGHCRQTPYCHYLAFTPSFCGVELAMMLRVCVMLHTRLKSCWGAFTSSIMSTCIQIWQNVAGIYPRLWPGSCFDPAPALQFMVIKSKPKTPVIYYRRRWLL